MASTPGEVRNQDLRHFLFQLPDATRPYLAYRQVAYSAALAPGNYYPQYTSITGLIERPDISGPPLRRNFNSLALFLPDLKTDAAGRAQASFQLPDNLTRYRLRAVAARGARQFGTGESTLTASLPLMVRPSAPRFLNLGDRCELPWWCRTGPIPIWLSKWRYEPATRDFPIPLARSSCQLMTEWNSASRCRRRRRARLGSR